MQLLGLALTSFLAFSASALPFDTNNDTIVEDQIIRPREPKHHEHHDTFLIHVHNKCPFEKEVALYSVTPSFQMVQRSKATTIQPGHKHTIHAPFKAIGMRLSGHAEWGLNGQWQPQALFEFGYSEYAGQQGTAYDLSIMDGQPDPDIGMGVYPHNKQCRSQTCFPWYCPPSQGWTNPDQDSLGSPADCVCYQGKTDFKVVYCP